MNSFWAHPQHVLLGAIYNSDKETRRLAVDRILACRPVFLKVGRRAPRGALKGCLGGGHAARGR